MKDEGRSLQLDWASFHPSSFTLHPSSLPFNGVKMFIAIYRWKVIEGQEERFQEGWHRRTLEIYRQFGSLGSRLRRAEDGTWFGYAQWPDKSTWDAAWSQPPP